ncbi:phosphotransacetylase [Syntrophus gentianae]|uniref:Phosphate acetyltransferase n=1 Tax=Syntrophus gentianae TaxID=43775 RepID=A0A1H7VZP6_9BACT|nr:phosphotransacetylase [Syntrophus gentianae]
MSNGLYITSLEPQSGKTIVALACMEHWSGRVERLSLFRPVVSKNIGADALISLMMDLYSLPFSADEMYGVTLADVKELLACRKYDDLHGRILERYKSLESRSDFILCVGTDYSGVSMALEFDFNVEIARNLGVPLLPIINGRGKDQDALVNSIRTLSESLKAVKNDVAAYIINRVDENQRDELLASLQKERLQPKPVYVLPEEPLLERPTVREISTALRAAFISGDEGRLDSEVSAVKVGAMELPNFLDHLEDGSMVITPGDRSDIIIGTLAADRSRNYPHTAGLLLTGSITPAPQVKRLIEGLTASPVPVIVTEMDTFSAAKCISNVKPSFLVQNKRKIAAVLGIVESYMDLTGLLERAVGTPSGRITPLMFQYELIHRAKQQRKHIVLPEGTEERILRAAEIVLLREVCDITLLGNKEEIGQKASALGLSLNGARILDPESSELLPTYAEAYYDARMFKGVSRELARDTMTDVSYFGTMMVHLGHADGMVSGAVHTTANTIRPSLEFVKTKPGILIVSSIFFMCLAERTLVYGDCAIVPDPTAEELADIAISSAETAETFGIEPRVAMLSYSTGESGSGAEVERVREATRLVRRRQPDLKVEGPIQYDAAIDITVAKVKLPDSEVAGRATVFIFPDLNAGNNAYKAVQRAANAVAIGPVLQGLNKPVNDLSRGALVADIVNTIVITAIQAQAGGRP